MRKIFAVCMMMSGLVAAACAMRPTVENFDTMDKNGDFVLTRDEVVPVYGEKEFAWMDTNGNNVVTRSEYNRYPNQSYGNGN